MNKKNKNNNPFLKFVTGDEIREIKVPQLAESLSEGDIRWDKGKLKFIP